MGVLSTAQAVRVFITNPAGNELEVTSLLVSLVTENERCGTGDDLKGYVKTTGTLVLNAQLPVGFAESLDPRNNDRWKQGNLVRVLIRRRNGTEVSHPRGALRILQTPNPTRRQGNLNIKVGCEFAYLDTVGEPESNTGFTINPLTGVTRRAAINLLADRAGLPQLGTEITSPNIFRLRSRLEGNRVEEIGNLALAASNFVWINGSRTMSATAFNLDATPTFTGLDADLNFSRYEIQLSDEPVPDDITVSTKRTRSSVRVIDAADSQIEGDIFANPSVLTTGEDGRKSELFPDDYPNDSSFTPVSRTTVTKTYDANGWLVREVEVTRAPRGLALKEDFPGDLTLIDTRISTTEYTIGTESQIYSNTGAVSSYYVKQIRTEVKELARLIQETPSDPQALLVSSVDKRRFSKFGNDWTEVQTSWDIRSKEVKTRMPIDKNTAPPNPTPIPKQNETTDVEDSADTAFTGNPPRRKRTFRLGLSVQGSDQTQNLANLIGRLQYGATQLAEWECEIPDTFLAGSYAPQQVWEITDQGFIYRYLSDGHVFACTPDSAVFSCVGYYLGRVQAGAVIPPYQILGRMTLNTTITGSITSGVIVPNVLQLNTTITGAIAAQETTAGTLGGITFTTTITGALDAVVPQTGSLNFDTSIVVSVYAPPVTPFLQDVTIYWFRPDSDKVTRDASNRVSQWRRSPSNNPSLSANQGTATSQPLWIASALNGRPAVQFDGVNDFLFSGSVTIPITTLYIVFRIDTTLTASAGLISFSQIATKAAISNEDIELAAVTGGGNSLRVFAQTSADDPMATSFVFDGNVIPIPSNASPLAVSAGWHWALINMFSSSGTKSYALGASAVGAIGNRHAAITVAEYHLYTQQLTAANIQQISDYVSFYYGI